MVHVGAVMDALTIMALLVVAASIVVAILEIRGELRAKVKRPIR